MDLQSPKNGLSNHPLFDSEGQKAVKEVLVDTLNHIDTSVSSNPVEDRSFPQIQPITSVISTQIPKQLTSTQHLKPATVSSEQTAQSEPSETTETSIFSVGLNLVGLQNNISLDAEKTDSLEEVTNEDIANNIDTSIPSNPEEARSLPHSQPIASVTFHNSSGAGSRIVKLLVEPEISE